MKKLRLALILLGAGVLAVLGVMLYVQLRYENKINQEFTPPYVSTSTTLMVLGASVKSDGTPSDALRDRLDTALDLYSAKIAGHILLTGDDGHYHADEIDVMRSYVTSNSVTGTDILIDGKGYRTYESCKNAKAAGLKKIIIVTQRFHMGRALYLCNSMGLDASGATADKSNYYNDIVYFWIRDLAASVKAWWDVNIWHPAPPV